MADSNHPFIQRQEYQLDPSAVSQASRLYPIDGYEIPPEILAHATRYHFIRVPLLGQFNPRAAVDNWCGRTSASMLWNYHRLVSGQVHSKDDYITHWRGSDGNGQMNLRYPKGDIAFVNPDGGYSFLTQLQNEFQNVELEKEAVLKDNPSDREGRLRAAE